MQVICSPYYLIQIIGVWFWKKKLANFSCFSDCQYVCKMLKPGTSWGLEPDIINCHRFHVLHHAWPYPVISEFRHNNLFHNYFEIEYLKVLSMQECQTKQQNGAILFYPFIISMVMLLVICKRIKSFLLHWLMVGLLLPLHLLLK